jgi:DNA modification methylase
MLQDWILSFRRTDGYRKSGWIDELGAWKKVRRIEIAGDAEVWDLQVEEDSSFTAEGAIVHNCPLQLEVVRRCLRLWSNPGDVVLSPFAGIGSEGYCAVQMGRRFVGVELKQSYYRQACANLRNAAPKQISLFGGGAQ